MKKPTNDEVKFLSAKKEKDLKQLPQIGPARAKKIIAANPKDVFEFSSCSGLSEKRMDAILAFLKENNIELKF